MTGTKKPRMRRADIKYYVMQYTTHDGMVVMSVTNRLDSWLRDKKAHPNFTFFTVDRLTMMLNEIISN